MKKGGAKLRINRVWQQNVLVQKAPRGAKTPKTIRGRQNFCRANNFSGGGAPNDEMITLRH